MRHTIEEYTRRELTALDKHEYHDGRIVAMSGGPPEHSRIIVNTTVAIHTGLRGKSCRIYDGNLRIRIPSTRRYLDPDCSVFCAPLEFDPEDPVRHSVTNPRLIVEAMTPATEAYDRGEKFAHYRNLASLTEYVLISHAKPLVETYVRDEGDRWLFKPFEGLDAVARLRAVAINLPLAEVYDGVTFAPEEAATTPS